MLHILLKVKRREQVGQLQTILTTAYSKIYPCFILFCKVLKSELSEQVGLLHTTLMELYSLVLSCEPSASLNRLLKISLGQQVGQLRTILTTMAEVVTTQGGPIFSMLMGDFNSTPGSAVYRFVRHGELDCGAEDRRNMAGQLEGAGQGWPPRHLRKV